MVDILHGVKIVSFTHYLFGPMAVQTLADLGAEVIAVEPLGGSWQRFWGGQGNKEVDGQSVFFLAVDRNKKSIAINLKSLQGYEIAKKLLADADALVTNYRPGVLDKLGFSFETLKEENPRLVYAAATGYGPDGPYIERPGQDLLIQAMSGLATVNGCQASGPRPVGFSAVDHHGAALLALGIVSALFKRERTGEGSRVDVSLLTAALDLQMEPLVCYLNGEKPQTTISPDNIAGWIYQAPYGVYAASDGHIVISLSGLKELGEALGAPEVAAYDDGENYVKREEIAAKIAERVAKKTKAEWAEILDRRKIWNHPVNDYADVLEDPQVRHNKSLVTLPGAEGSPITLVSHPIRYDGEVPPVKLPPQQIGAQSFDILTELGYSPEHIEEMEADGVIRCHHG